VKYAYAITFDSANLVHGPAELLLRPVCDLISKDIWGLVSSIAQSARGIDIAENFDVRVFNIATPVGRGRKSNHLHAKT